MNTFKLLRKIKVPELFRSTPEKEEAKIKEYTDGDPPMKNILNWFKEKKSWWSLWLLLFIIVTALSTCSELKITYEYKTPPVVKKLLGNK